MNEKICFVSHNAYGAMRGGDVGHIGGVERQVSLMARWFAGKKYQTSLLTWDEGQGEEESISDVRMLKICRADAGLKFLRFFVPKWTGLVRAMKRADADIYYQNGAECVTGQVALWCKANKKKFVFSTAADVDCERWSPAMPTVRDQILYKYGIKNADGLIVQTANQRRAMLTNFGRESVVLPMPCPIPAQGHIPGFRERDRKGLWVGRICEAKRPDRLLNIAEAMPDLSFDVVGPSDNSLYAQSFLRRANLLPNLILHGAKARSEVPSYYSSSRFLLCTSSREGFPNTFLEAWSFGLPVVSTVDPDSLIEKWELGAAVHDHQSCLEPIRELCETGGRWEELSRNCRRYFDDNHSMESAMARFATFFEQMGT